MDTEVREIFNVAYAMTKNLFIPDSDPASFEQSTTSIHQVASDDCGSGAAMTGFFTVVCHPQMVVYY